MFLHSNYIASILPCVHHLIHDAMNVSKKAKAFHSSIGKLAIISPLEIQTGTHFYRLVAQL